MSTKPSIDDIVTAFSALRLTLVEDAGICGAMAAAWEQDAVRFRRAGEYDVAISAEQRAQEARAMGLRLFERMQTIGRIFGDPPTRIRTGEWRAIPTPEETAESLADTVPIDRSEIAEANANED